MAKTKKQIQRETRRKKTTLKGRKKANMRGGQDKYTVPKNLELNNPMSDFTDITSNNIFLNMSKQFYLKFYQNVEKFIAKKNYANKTTYLRTLRNYLNNGKENPDDIKYVVYGLRDLIIPDDITKKLKSSLLKYTKNLYNNIRNEFNKPDIRENPCSNIFIANVGTKTPIILNKKQLETITNMRDPKELFEFFSYLLDYLKFDPDDKCMPLGRGKIRCACYNKTEMTEIPAYDSDAQTTSSQEPEYAILGQSALRTGATANSNTHYDRLNKNRQSREYAKLSRVHNRNHTMVNNPLYKGKNPYYSEPVNPPRNNGVYASINNIMGDQNNNYTNWRHADWRLANKKAESPYFTNLQQQANATYGNAQKTLEKSVARKNQEYKNKPIV